MEEETYGTLKIFFGEVGSNLVPKAIFFKYYNTPMKLDKSV